MRREFNEEEQMKLTNASKLIRDYTDLGLDLWMGVFVKNEDITYQLPSVLLFRQILESADSISELIKEGCVSSCKPLMRSALDCYLQFSFLIKDDEQRKASHFLYHYNKGKLNDLERVMYPSKKNSLNEN